MERKIDGIYQFNTLHLYCYCYWFLYLYLSLLARGSAGSFIQHWQILMPSSQLRQHKTTGHRLICVLHFNGLLHAQRLMHVGRID